MHGQITTYSIHRRKKYTIRFSNFLPEKLITVYYKNICYDLIVISQSYLNVKMCNISIRYYYY